MTAAKHVVVNEERLCYRQVGSAMLGVLAHPRHTILSMGPIFLSPSCVVRRATEADFDRFRVQLPPDFVPAPPVTPFDPIIFDITYSDTTPESAATGEHSDSGHLFEEYACADFAEVSSMVREFGNGYWSSSPHTPGAMGDWLQADQGTICYATGTTRETSIHPRNARSLRYLEKAAKMWGVR